MKEADDLFRKALERLVASLSVEEGHSNRIEMVEEALTYAQIVMGKKPMTEAEHTEFMANMEALGIQILVDSMDRQDLALYRAKVTFSDDDNAACIIVTAHPVLAPLIDRHVEQMVNAHPDKPKTNYEVN